MNRIATTISCLILCYATGDGNGQDKPETFAGDEKGICYLTFLDDSQVVSVTRSMTDMFGGGGHTGGTLRLYKQGELKPIIKQDLRMKLKLASGDVEFGVDHARLTKDGKKLVLGMYSKILGPRRIVVLDLQAEKATVKERVVGNRDERLHDVSPDGRYLISHESTFTGEYIIVREVDSLKEVRFSGNISLKNQYCSCSCLLDGNKLGVFAHGTDEKGVAVVRLWDLATGKSDRTLNMTKSAVFGLTTDSSGNRLVATSVDDMVHVFDTKNWELLRL